MDLLVDLFSEVLIPQSIAGEFGNIQLPEKVRISEKSIPGRKFVLGAMGFLHEGELEAIEKAEYILLDDLSARRKAKRMGLKVKGTIGLILAAFRHEKISKEQGFAFLEELTEKHGLFITKDILERTKDEFRR